MTRTIRWQCAAVALACAALTPAAALADNTSRVASAALPESLTSQEREILTLALDFSRRCSDTLERWIASKETTQEKLFSFLYYPIARTDPPKFNTDWDGLSDRDILPIEEGVLAKSPAIAFAVLVDRNGYLPTHNQRYSLPLTGNPASDLVNNRTKRIFNDRTGLTAARNRLAFLIQRYQRDTSETMADLSVPVYVLGKHWGAVRIDFRVLDGR